MGWVSRLDFGHIGGHHPRPPFDVHSLVQTVRLLRHTALQFLKSLWSATNISEEPHQLRLSFPANEVSGPGADGDGRRDQGRIWNLLSHLEQIFLRNVVAEINFDKNLHLYYYKLRWHCSPTPSLHRQTDKAFPKSECHLEQKREYLS